MRNVRDIPQFQNIPILKQMPDTPEWLAGLRVSYTDGSWYGNLDTKFTGMNYSTLVNDETVAGTALVNATLGYRFGDVAILKKPTLQLNILNLFDRNYVRINSGSGSSFTQTAANTPFYYIGSPRFVSVTLRTDF